MCILGRHMIPIGSISFSFMRDDVAMPASFLEEWRDTGVDPWTNTTVKPFAGAWAGPGHILAPSDKASNPDVEIPNNIRDNGKALLILKS